MILTNRHKRVISLSVVWGYRYKKAAFFMRSNPQAENKEFPVIINVEKKIGAKEMELSFV